MRNKTKCLVLVLLLSSIILPILPTITVAQDEEEPIIFRYATASLPGDWDQTISDWYNVLYLYYFFAACEYVCGGNSDYWAGLKDKTKEEEYKPILCTEWETTWRPEDETNAAGFNNTGGRESTLFTLREGVKFHDGSEWNATVMKWNIDRLYLISGNLTGIGDQYRVATYWSMLEDTDYQFFTPSWNLSHFDAPELKLPTDTPNKDDYPGYFIGNDTTYPGVPAVDGWVYNLHPYGGWDYEAKAPIHYAPYDYYPLVKWVEIVEEGGENGGGKVRVHFNTFQTYGMSGMWTPQISYAAYHKNYTARGVYGYDNDVKDPKNPTKVQHLIGTGPYKYVMHSETASPAGGYMIKNEDYWNKTALEDDGWFDVDRLEFVNFPPGELGKDAKNTALLTHAIDYAYDQMNMPVDYDAVMANPNIDYIEDYPSDYMTQITLNSINETYWSDNGTVFWWSDFTWRDTYFSDKGEDAGIPRALRKAINYAFNYDKMIHTVLDDRAIRGGRVVGEGSVFYNESVPMPQYDLDYAREILLTTEDDNFTVFSEHWANIYPDLYNFSKRCADRGLTATSTDAKWQNVAETDPIFVLDFYWDDAHEDLKNVFQESLANIGVALKDPTGATNKVPTIIWDTVRTYWLSTFDGTHSIWSAHAWVMDYNYPRTIPEGWIAANYYYPQATEGFPWWNFGFNYDEDINYWIDVMYRSEPHRKLEMISKIAYKECNELYPMIWCYQAKGGACLWKDWESLYVENRLGNRTFYWGGGPSVSLLRYVGLPKEAPLIPGSPLVITLTVSAVSMIGIIYAMMRKKKLR